jgi:hypothetical protein
MSSQPVDDLLKHILDGKNAMDKDRIKNRRLIVIALAIFWVIVWVGENILLTIGVNRAADMTSGIGVEIVGAFITFMIIDTIWTNHESDRNSQLQIMSYATVMVLKKTRYKKVVQKCMELSAELKRLEEEMNANEGVDNTAARQSMLTESKAALVKADRLDDECVEATEEFLMFIQIYYPAYYEEFIKQISDEQS